MTQTTLQQLRDLAASGPYRTLPVSREIFSDIRTPLEVLRALKNVSRHCFLLESVEEYPYKLGEEARERYGAYLRGHMSCAGRVYVERQDMRMLRFFGQAGYWDREGLETAIDAAAEKKETEILGFLMDERRRLFPKKKKVFEL